MFWRSTLAVALLWFVASSKVLALGLGGIEIDSVLNNPLRAVVELTSATDAELEELKVSIASSEAFARAGITRTRILNDFNFSVERTSAGKPVIRISTTEPVREAFLEFLLEVAWSRGRLVRQYTVLVDPPYTMPAIPVAPRPPVIPAAPAVSVQPAPAPAPPTVSVQPAPAPPTVSVQPAPAPPAVSVQPAPAPTRQARPAPPPPPVAPAPVPARTTDQYGPVRRSETLWDIAKKLRPGSDISMQQMMLALQRANPAAFIHNNINYLRAGAVLQVPERDEVLSLSRSDAIAEARRQYDEWRSARSGETAPAQQAAETVPEAAPESAPEIVTEARLQLMAPEGDDTAGAAGTTGAEAEAEAQPALEDAPASSELQQQLALATEAAEAERAQGEELQSRVSKLEEQVEAMKRLIELKDAQLAGMQNRLGLEDEVTADAADEVDAEPLTTVDASPAAEEQVSTVVAEAEPTPATEPASVAEVIEDVSGMGEPRRLVDRLLDNPVLTALGVFAAMVLGGFLWATTRQRRNDDIFGDEPTMESQLAESQAGLRQEPVIPAVPVVEQETDSPRAAADKAAQQDTESGDPLTEADVYIAYGRFQQAQDVIQGALQDNPGDTELTLKLLEIYRLSGNTKAFNTLAASFHTVAGDDSPLWKKVAVMGYELSPDNDLYRSAWDSPAASASDIDLDTNLSGMEEMSPEAGLSEDLHSLEADTGFGELADNTIEFSLDNTGVLDEEDASEGLLNQSDEVATKLDLARAYLDMSDPESARSILEEVLDEGNEQQKVEAQELFVKLTES